LNPSYCRAAKNFTPDSPQVVPHSSLTKNNPQRAKDSLEEFMAVVPRSSLAAKDEESSLQDSPGVVPLSSLAVKDKGSSLQDSPGVVPLSSLAAKDDPSSLQDLPGVVPSVTSVASVTPITSNGESQGGSESSKNLSQRTSNTLKDNNTKDIKWATLNRDYLKSLEQQRLALERSQEQDLPSMLQERSEIVEILATGHSMPLELFKDYQWKKIQLDVQITQLQEAITLNEKLLTEHRTATSAAD
jgi:hypothetical protein